MRDDPNAKPYIGPASATYIIVKIIGLRFNLAHS